MSYGKMEICFLTQPHQDANIKAMEDHGKSRQQIQQPGENAEEDGQKKQPRNPTSSPAVRMGASVHLIKGVDMSQQLEFDFYHTEYSIQIRDGVEWRWKTFKTSLTRKRLTESFSCQAVEAVGICPKHNYHIHCDMARHCHVMLNIPEDDPDWPFGKLCTVCFHEAITKLG